MSLTYNGGDSLTDIVLGGGYDGPSTDFSNPWIIIPGQDPIYIPVGVVGTTPTTGTTITVVTTTPTQDPVVTSPIIEAPAMEIAKLMGSAWDTTARSINPFHSYLRFTVGDISGACMMIGPEDMDGLSISQFTHGLAIDISGVHVYESGAFKASLRSVPSFGSEFRIYRQPDNSIVYAVITGTETVVYHSPTPCPVPEFIDLYAYGRLYSSGDQITDASFEDGEVLSTGTATLSGAGLLQGGTCKAFLEGAGSLIYQQTAAICSGSGTLYAKSSSDYIRANFPSFGCQMFETVDGYGAINVTFPAFTAYLEELAFVPATPEFIFALFPAFVCSMTTTTIGRGSINTNLPALVGRIFEEEEYGELSATFPVGWGMMFEGPPVGTKYLLETVYALDASKTVYEHIVFINNVGTIVDTITATRIAIASIIEQITASDSYTVIGTFTAPLMETATIVDTMIAGVMQADGSEAAILDKTARVWVVNMDTGASSQYDDYGFNSWFKDEETGEIFGLADDGIYRLDGDTDAGVQIDAEIEFGKTDHGTYLDKKATSVHVGISSDQKMYMKVQADGVEKIYQLDSYGSEIKARRVPVLYNHHGSYWNFTLMNADGCDFELAGIEWQFTPLTWKVK